MKSLRPNAECPSLSPDQTKIAYKKRLDNKARGVWRLACWIFGLGRESLLAETGSVDDQVEWLDNNRLLHALSRPGSEGDNIRRVVGLGRWDRRTGGLHSRSILTSGSHR